MNGTERIMATLTGQPIDRRAVNLVLSLYGARLTEVPLDRYFTDPAEYVRGQAAIRTIFDPDIMYGPFAFAIIAAAFGCKIRWHNDQAPTVCNPAVGSGEEMYRLLPPDPDTHPHLLFIREATRRMVEEYRGEVSIAVPMPPPIDLPTLIMGIDAWLDLVLFDPEGASRVLGIISDFIVRFANCLFADGANFMAMPCAFGSPAIVTREMLTDFSRPALIAAYSQFNGPVVLHHGGAPILKHLDLLTGLPQVVGYVVDQNDDLDKARTIIGEAPVLIGGLNAPGMADMTAAQVERHCLSVLKNRRDDLHFILGTCAPDVPLETPPENISAIKRAAEIFAGGES